MCAAGHLFLLCIDELWPTHPPGLFSCTLHMLVCLCSAVALSSFSGFLWSGLCFRLFCILVLDGQCTVGAWRAARSWCACCLGEPRARGSVMNCNSLHQKLLFELMIVPGSYRCLCSDTNHLIWTSRSFKSTTSEDPGICLAAW